MSTLETPASATTQHPTDAPAIPKKTLHVWPAVLLVAIYWIFFLGLAQTDVTMFFRFVSRMIALALLFLIFLGWWTSRGSLRWRDRWIGLAIFFGLWGLTGAIADPTMNHVVLLMSSVPAAVTVWTAWLVIVRNRSIPLLHGGLLLGLGIVFGFFTLLRWDGLDGAQRAELSWRWEPTAEQRFLANHARQQEKVPAIETEAITRWTLRPGDWPEFRGTHRDGQAPHVAPQNWAEHLPSLIWRQRIGPAWSSMILVDQHLVTQEQRGDQETTVCYDAATGRELWAHGDELRFFEGLSGAGPRATPTFHADRIYAYGATGRLNCLDAVDGELIWSHDVLNETGGAVPQWGLSVSPLVTQGLVIVFAGGKENQGVIAYRINDGQLAWSAPAGRESFSSPQLITLEGTQQVLMHDNVGLKAFRPEDGALLWELPIGNGMFQPMLQPHAIDDHRLLVQNEDGLILLEPKRTDSGWTPEVTWKSNRMKVGFNDFVVHDGAIYGLDDGILCCLELETGKRKWKNGRYGHGQVLLLEEQGQLIVATEQGGVVLVAADPGQFRELGKFTAIEGKTWNHPIVAHNRLFVRNGEQIACFRLGPDEQIARPARNEPAVFHMSSVRIAARTSAFPDSSR